MKHKNIKKIEDLNEEINQLEKYINELIKEKKEDRIIAYKLLKPKYEITIQKCQFLDIQFKKEPIDGIRINLDLKNKKEFDKHYEYYGLMPSFYKNSSPHMFRINNVCIFNGSGTHIIKKNSIINDEEWELICSGIIPEHLKNIDGI